MTHTLGRRRFVATVLGGAAATFVPLHRSYARSDSPQLASTPLGDRLAVITGAGANVVAMRGPDGALMVDGGLPEHSADLIRYVLEQNAAPRVHTLFNTHWHPEHTGSNERVGKTGARIIAHENTRLWLGYANEVPLQNRTYGPLPAKALPNETIYTSGDIRFGDEEIEYGYVLQAHTDGDIYVRFRKANVLVTGGIVVGEGWPIIDYKTGGWIGGLVQGLQTLIRLCDENTRVVPATGPPLRRADLEARHKMFATIFDRLSGLLRKGMSPEEAFASGPTKEFEAQMGDSRQFVMLAFRSLWGHFAPDA